MLLGELKNIFSHLVDISEQSNMGIVLGRCDFCLTNILTKYESLCLAAVQARAEHGFSFF